MFSLSLWICNARSLAENTLTKYIVITMGNIIYFEIILYTTSSNIEKNKGAWLYIVQSKIIILTFPSK